MQPRLADRAARLPSRAYERLLEISVQLNARHDVDELIQYIVETAASLLDCGAASLLLYDAKVDRLRFIATTGSDASALQAILVPVSGSVAGRIFAENRPIVEQDVAQAQDHFEEVDRTVEFQTRSLLGVPMRIAGKPTGVLEALNKRNGAFTDEDSEILTILASHAAIALRNARQIASLEAAVEKLRSLDKLKSDFLALASHELRTPLASILGVLGLLRSELSEAHALFLEDALDAGERITGIIDTMCQLDTLRREADHEYNESIEVSHIISTARARCVEQETARGHRVRMDGLDGGSLVAGDEEGLISLFSNLLENAYQFTPDGGAIRIEVSEARGFVTVSVEDSGIGIAADQIEAVFGDFYQVEDHLTRTHGGLGLGLAIARKIAVRHRGTIEAFSEGVGKGSRFTVVLPAAR